MAFVGLKVAVGGTAVPICNPLAASQLLVQNLGAGPVTLCGPGGVYGTGIVLPASMTTAQIVAVAHYGAFQDPDDQLYAITQGGGTICNVVVLQPY
jgi:hypothetical protein